MRQLLFTLLVFSSQYFFAQPDSLFFKKSTKDEFPKWSINSKVNLDISEVAFVNWNAGGSNSISALIGLAHESNYKYKQFYWNNNFVARYGVNKQESQELRKTEDLVEINSNLGYRKDSLTNWFFTSRFNFKTQFANGYNYPNTVKPISRFMAPGYLFFGGGIEYGKNIEKFSLYFSPLTLKSTFVLDQELANDGAFGVTPANLDEEGNIIEEGERVRNEFGILITNAYETEVLKNINMKHLVSFYTDYLNDFGNVDVDWQVNLDFKVNSFVRATLGSHLKYDNDIKTQVLVDEEEDEYVEEGAKVQWKQILGVGVVVGF